MNISEASGRELDQIARVFKLKRGYEEEGDKSLRHRIANRAAIIEHILCKPVIKKSRYDIAKESELSGKSNKSGINQKEEIKDIVFNILTLLDEIDTEVGEGLPGDRIKRVHSRTRKIRELLGISEKSNA